MEDAINQLQDLGVTRGQAKRALARYNNDVARAADYIFSGAVLSDDDDAEESGGIEMNSSSFPSDRNTLETDEEMALRLSLEEQQQQQQQQQHHHQRQHSNNAGDNTPATASTTGSIAYLDKSAKSTSIYSESAGTNWSVVPFTPKETSLDKTITSSTSLSASFPSSSCSANTASTSVMDRYNSLTWWSEPENPNDRKALDNIPAGLRPPSYNAAYAPILIQALFHITAFQQFIFSYRPTPYTYGHAEQCKEFWKGFGEPVPGYIMHEVHTRVPVARSNATATYTTDNTWHEAQSSDAQMSEPSTSTPDTDNDDKIVTNLIDIDEDDKIEETMKDLTLEDSNTMNWVSETEPNSTDAFRETMTSAPLEGDIEYEEYTTNELQSVPKSVQALAELQRIFGFLGHTKRRYGNIAHFVRALNASAKEAYAANQIVTPAYNDFSTDWGASDKSFDAFFEMMINCLLEASGHAEDSAYEAKLKSLFQLKAKIVYGDEMDTEEVNYLTLNTDEHMNSVHACLDPFVYESFGEQQQTDMDDNRDPSMSDSEDEEKEKYKFTTFTEIPPIFTMVLESRDPTNAKFNIEQTIYLDRYLEEKKHITLDGFKQLDAYRKEIQKCRTDLDKLSSNSNSGADRALSKTDILESALAYFKLKEEATTNKDEGDDEEENAISSAEVDLVQSVLSQAKLSIETKIKDLESRINIQQEKVANLFDDNDELKSYPYRLQASFHHDGLSGTGHYWAYIWVEPSIAVEENLLQDIPLDATVEQQNHDEHARGGGWFKFCDASVEPISESDIYADSTSPFALIYTAADNNPKKLPKFSKEELYNEYIPGMLKEFIAADNELFEDELYNYNHPESAEDQLTLQQPAVATMTPVSPLSHNLSDAALDDALIGEDIPIREKQGSVHYEHVLIEDTGSSTFNSTNPFVSSNFSTTNSSIPTFSSNNPFIHYQQQQSSPNNITHSEHIVEHEAPIDPVYSFSGQPFVKLRDRVNNEIIKVSNYSKDDYRLLKSFEAFLARTQHKLNLEHLYLLYSKEKTLDADLLSDVNETSGVERKKEEDASADYVVDEESAREDSELKLIWKEFESYSAIGRMMTEALVSFLKKDFVDALQQLLEVKRAEATWKTHLMLDTDFSHAYSGLVTISYNDMVKKYGKACLQIMNNQAYVRAVDPDQRTAGLQDAIKIAHQAQMVIGPDHIQEDPLYSTFKELWLSFTENENVMAGPGLLPEQVELLNQLFMIYLEGHSGGIGWSANSSAAVSRCASPIPDEADEDKDYDLPLWQRYKEVCTEAEHLLALLTN